MYRNAAIRKIWTPLMLALYLFVALFSQNFHDHGSGGVFSDLQFRKAEKSFSAAVSFASYNDCLSCHLLHEGKHLPYTAFGFSLTVFATNVPAHVSPDAFFYSTDFFHTATRGPPCTSFI